MAHTPKPKDPLARLTPEQQHGVLYLTGHENTDPNDQVQVHQRDDGIAVVLVAEGAAIIATNGDFLDPSAGPDEPPVVTLPYSEYSPQVIAHLQAEARQSAQDN